MKYYLILTFCFVLAISNNSFGQVKYALNAFGGYTFQDKVDFADAYGYINDGAHYGGSIEFFLRPEKSLEIMYQRMDTEVPLFTYGGLPLNEDNLRASINYLMLNGTNYFPVKPNLHPYAGLGLGAAFLGLKDGDSYTKFAWDARLGLRFKTSGPLSIKIQAQIFSVVQGAGGGLYLGTGGAGAGVSTYSSMYQFGFTGGLMYELGGVKSSGN